MTEIHSQRYRAAVSDFHRARQQAALQEIVARPTGKSIELLSYDEVYRKLRPTGRADRGLREIPLDAIVGTMGRYTDFTRTFLPRHDRDEGRWASVKAIVDETAIDALPPIEVYQIGEAYFVQDGHHRVSVARQEGLTHILAHVIEVRTQVPLSPDIQPDELIWKSEYAAFLESTRLDQLPPEADLSVSVPGQYTRLENHVEVHRYFKEMEQGRDIPYDEAVGLWYDEVYLPVVQVIREQGILRYFPQRTETDLYVWVSEHRAALQREFGWQIGPDVAAAKLAARFSPRSDRVVARVGKTILNAVLPDALKSSRATGEWRTEKLVARYSDRLFAEILVPVSGEELGWQALEQAMAVARREGAHIRGLYIVSSEANKKSEAAQAVQAEFDRRLQQAGLAGSLALEVGDVARKIVERAVLTDLVVLAVAHPPAPQPVARLGSRLRTIVRRCAMPVLAVPHTSSPLDRALLAYDGSSKAKEALFAAAYLAERWKIELAVMSVIEAGHPVDEALDHARKYLEMHEVQAAFVQDSGPVAETILKTADDHRCNVIIMGDYGRNPIVDVVLGGAADQVLRESSKPVLLCG